MDRVPQFGVDTVLVRLSRAAFVLAALHVIVAVGVSFSDNPEGRLGGILYAALYGVPLVLIGLGLRSGERRLTMFAGWAALVLGAYYTLVVVGNWSGYASWQATFAVAITTPTTLLLPAIFWGAILHRPKSAST